MEANNDEPCQDQRLRPFNARMIPIRAIGSVERLRDPIHCRVFSISTHPSKMMSHAKLKNFKKNKFILRQIDCF
jgi:hypothetical protein